MFSAMLSAVWSLVFICHTLLRWRKQEKKGKKWQSAMEGKWTPGCGVLTPQLHLTDIPWYKHQHGRTQQQHREHLVTELNTDLFRRKPSLQEAMTCTDIRSSLFRVVLHILLTYWHWKRDVSFFILKYTHPPHVLEILQLADPTGKQPGGLVQWKTGKSEQPTKGACITNAAQGR